MFANKFLARRTRYAALAAVLSIACLLAACASNAAPAPPSTATLDPCSAGQLPGQVDKVNKLMREFDDASYLATNTPRDQLPPVISDMQRIHRAAEDQIVPACLATLKQLELKHMNTVIDTLVGFLGGADQNALNQGTLLARKQHNNYALEFARLLGLTVVVAPTSTKILATDTAAPPTAALLYATNLGAADINLYADASLQSKVVAVLAAKQNARVVSQSPDGLWIQVQVPGQSGHFAWVQASAVTVAPAAP